MNYIEERVNKLLLFTNELYNKEKTLKEQKKIIRDMYSEINKLKSALENEFEAIENFEREDLK